LAQVWLVPKTAPGFPEIFIDDSYSLLTK